MPDLCLFTPTPDGIMRKCHVQGVILWIDAKPPPAPLLRRVQRITITPICVEAIKCLTPAVLVHLLSFA